MENAERIWLLKLLEDPLHLAWVKEQVRRAEAFHAAVGAWSAEQDGLPEIDAKAGDENRGDEQQDGGDRQDAGGKVSLGAKPSTAAVGGKRTSGGER